MMKIIKLRYNRIFSVPILSHLFYLVEILLLKVNKTDLAFASTKDNAFKNILYRTLNESSSLIEIQSYKFGLDLMKISCLKRLNIDHFDFESGQVSELHTVMWSVVQSQELSSKTKNVLKKIL